MKKSLIAISAVALLAALTSCSTMGKRKGMSQSMQDSCRMACQNRGFKMAVGISDDNQEGCTCGTGEDGGYVTITNPMGEKGGLDNLTVKNSHIH
jgi:hypothetical protein